MAEAKRRAAILRRYVAIDLPTAEDDRRFAGELGVAEDTLIRLARAWLRGRDVRLLAGPEAALARPDAPGRDAVMAEAIDMDGVDPRRRNELLRRIRGIQAHLAEVESGKGDSAAAAAAIGVSHARFKELVKRWRMHARAEAMPGASVGSRTWRRNEGPRRRGIEILRAILDQNDASPMHSIHALYAEACRAEGLKPLSLPRIYGLVRELRQARSRDQSGGADAEAKTSA